jgi:hypothetical protein
MKSELSFKFLNLLIATTFRRVPPLPRMAPVPIPKHVLIGAVAARCDSPPRLALPVRRAAPAHSEGGASRSTQRRSGLRRCLGRRGGRAARHCRARPERRARLEHQSRGMMERSLSCAGGWGGREESRISLSPSKMSLSRVQKEVRHPR